MQRDGLFGGEDFQASLDLEKILEDLGIDVVSETDYAYLVHCIYHNNRNSTAATVAKHNGFFYCHGAGCEKRISLEEMVKEIKGFTTMKAKRYLAQNSGKRKSLDQVIQEIQATKEELPPFPETTLEVLQKHYEESNKVQDYIDSRGIKPETAKHFGLGYDPNKKMVLTPMRASDGTLIGLIGRTIEGEKAFKNSKNLPSRKTLFGINIAKKMNSDFVVLCESNFDAIRAWQSGYAAVATLGGTFSDYHRTQINKFFNKVIIAVDADEQGQKFASKIAEKCRAVGLSVHQARFSEAELFPHDAKDFGDCTDDEIAWMIRNSDIFEG